MYQGSQEAKINALTSEIERLKAEREEWQMRLLSLRTLLTSAADAPEKVASYVSGDSDAYRYLRLEEQRLIQELRKAAE
jgi:hypothetical protein